MRHVFQEGYDDPHKPLPSPVVHIRGLVDGVMEADLVEALQEFGVVRSETKAELRLDSEIFFFFFFFALKIALYLLWVKKKEASVELHCP